MAILEWYLESEYIQKMKKKRYIVEKIDKIEKEKRLGYKVLIIYIWIFMKHAMHVYYEVFFHVRLDIVWIDF